MNEFLLNVSYLMLFFLQILIYYDDDAERKGSSETDPHQGSLQCCIVGKVIGPARFLAEDIRPFPFLDYFQKTLIFSRKDSFKTHWKCSLHSDLFYF